MMRKQLCLKILLLSFQLYQPAYGSSSSRSAATSMAEQLIFGVKRAVYYMNTLLEKCDNVGNLNQWILFMDFYLKCESEGHSSKLKLSSRNEGDFLGRLNSICTAWPNRRKCSSRLASKLNSCLDSQLEEGMAGTNALSLTNAQMKFICRHKHEYTKNVEAMTGNGEVIPFEKRPLKCFREIEKPLANCIGSEGLITQKTFCSNFNLAKDCVINTSMEHCKNHAARSFLFDMFEQIQMEIQCPSSSVEK